MRTNRTTKHTYGLPVDVVDSKVRATAKRYHWGIPATQVIDWNDPDYPRHPIQEMGRLCEMHVEPLSMRSNRTNKPVVMPIPKQWWDDFPKGGHAKIAKGSPQPRRPQAHVAFDPKHKNQRLYLLMPDALQRDYKGLFRRTESVDLNDLAKYVGGRQATRDYPHIAVTPLGVFSHIVYYIAKEGDGDNGEDGDDPRSQYIHEFGEESGLRPWLSVDSRGRLWLAGGNYTVPKEGIAD